MTLTRNIKKLVQAGTIAVAATLPLGTVAHAATVADDFSSFWVLGDSLSDTGNLAAATGGAFPGPLYFEDRFSNGPLWADFFSRRFERAGKATGNVAFGGATAVTNLDTIPDLVAQTGLFRFASTGLLGARPLVALWFGGNDIGNTAGTGTAIAAAQAAAANIATQAISLLDTTTDFLIFNMPDVGATPRFQFGDPAAAIEATQASAAFNVAILDSVMEIANAGGTVTLVDVAALEPELAAAGITNFTTPCIVSGTLVCTEEQAAVSQYWDPFHPTAVVHQIAGENALSAFGAVPVPAAAPLLLGALGLLGWVRRRA